MGKTRKGWGRGWDVLELIGALQAWGVPQSSPLQKGLASGCWALRIWLRLLTQYWSQYLLSKNRQGTSLVLRFFFSAGVDLFSVSQSVVISTWDDYRWFVDMALKNSGRHSGKIIVCLVYFSPWRIKGESLDVVLLSPKIFSVLKQLIWRNILNFDTTAVL